MKKYEKYSDPNHPELLVKPMLPKTTIKDITDSKTIIKLLDKKEVDGNISTLELQVITRIIKEHKCSSIFEIGTFDGRTTLNMIANAPKNAKIYTLDLPKDMIKKTNLKIVEGDKNYINKNVSGKKFLDTPYKKRIIQLYGDSATFDFKKYESKIGFVFVDGSHSYEYTINDSIKAFDLLQKNKGIVVWHDYTNWNGVTLALNELYKTNKDFRNLRHIKGTRLVYLEH